MIESSIYSGLNCWNVVSDASPRKYYSWKPGLINIEDIETYSKVSIGSMLTGCSFNACAPDGAFEFH